MLRGTIAFMAGVAVVLITGWYVFPRVLYSHTPQPVQFSHRIHADKAGMKCDDCHSLRADGTFTGIPQIDKCAGCHATPAGTTPDEKLVVVRYVTPNREIPWKVYSRQPDNVWFPHASHLTLAKLSCEQCHGDHGKTDRLDEHKSNRLSGYNGGLNMSKCERCHREKAVVTSCIDCHK